MLGALRGVSARSRLIHGHPRRDGASRRCVYKQRHYLTSLLCASIAALLYLPLFLQVLFLFFFPGFLAGGSSSSSSSTCFFAGAFFTATGDAVFAFLAGFLAGGCSLSSSDSCSFAGAVFAAAAGAIVLFCAAFNRSCRLNSGRIS
jgi:hypothetical protein